MTDPMDLASKHKGTTGTWIRFLALFIHSYNTFIQVQQSLVTPENTLGDQAFQRLILVVR
jgi:hypothetical protein